MVANGHKEQRCDRVCQRERERHLKEGGLGRGRTLACLSSRRNRSSRTIRSASSRTSKTRSICFIATFFPLFVRQRPALSGRSTISTKGQCLAGAAQPPKPRPGVGACHPSTARRPARAAAAVRRETGGRRWCSQRRRAWKSVCGTWRSSPDNPVGSLAHDV